MLPIRSLRRYAPPIVGWGLEQPNRPPISGARRVAQVHVNRRNEVGMSQKFLDYLNREHARLEQEIEVLMKRRLPDEIGIARLKKLKLAVKDQIAQHPERRISGASRLKTGCGIDRRSRIIPQPERLLEVNRTARRTASLGRKSSMLAGDRPARNEISNG
jgi:hypothetical protein